MYVCRVKEIKHNIMNNPNLKKILRTYAIEDLEILENNKFSAITGTKNGCLHNSFVNGVYSISYNNQSCLFQTPDRECVIDFFMQSYKIN